MNLVDLMLRAVMVCIVVLLCLLIWGPRKKRQQIRLTIKQPEFVVPRDFYFSPGPHQWLPSKDCVITGISFPHVAQGGRLEVKSVCLVDRAFNKQDIPFAWLWDSATGTITLMMKGKQEIARIENRFNHLQVFTIQSGQKVMYELTWPD